MTVAVRTAKPGDGEVIWTLVCELATEQGEMDQLTATPEDIEIALFGSNPVCGCELAMADGEVVGQAFWHRSFSIYRGKRCLYIENIFVRQKFRRIGAAHALLQRLATIAQDDGYAAIYWLMMDGNIPGQAFYKSIGAEFETGIDFYRLKDEALRRLAAA
jgi:GNAT superfamily N-acetyltransferase